MNAYSELLDDTVLYLRQLKELGVDSLPLKNRIRIPATKQEQLDKLAKSIANCNECKLCEGRTQVVFADGTPDAELMFIGEAPGHDEDVKGLPFVGRAGQLLTRMIEAMGFKRSEVYIGNIIKCRPPDNRPPEPDEIAACIGKLKRQIEIVQPRVIVLLGKTAVTGMLGLDETMGRMRGRWMECDGIPAMVTYHPSYLLRSPDAKKDVWQDMLLVLDKLGRKPPPKKTE